MRVDALIALGTQINTWRFKIGKTIEYLDVQVQTMWQKQCPFFGEKSE